MKKVFTIIKSNTNRGFRVLDEFDYLFELGYVKFPSRKTEQSAGYDIASTSNYVINPGTKKVISTGLTAYMNSDEYLSLFIRSGLAYNHDLTLSNATGIIDADYEGEHIELMVRNEGATPIEIKTGDRIAQGIFMKYLTTDQDNEQQKVKRTGGFGSTGKN